MTNAMKCLSVVLLALGLCCSGALGKKGFGDGGQEYGYVDVRSGAHMFYWLFYVNGGEVPAGKPLIIWLQGGPGASSTSYGNFEEIGPLDSDLKKRNSTWVNHVNVLFLDNPVGTGYSYVDHYSELTTNNQQIATDLVEFTRSFMTTYPQFQRSPLYIFSESYGGKMAAEFALNLYRAQRAGTVLSNLKGVSLGDSWISPVDSVMTWAPFLLQTGMVDTKGYAELQGAAQQVKSSMERRRFFEAWRHLARAESVYYSVTQGADICNILKKIPKEKARTLERAIQRRNYQGPQGVSASPAFLLPGRQGMVDTKGCRSLQSWALRTKEAVDRGRWDDATDLWGQFESAVMSEAYNVDFYNVLSRIEYYGRTKATTSLKPREVLFHNHVARAASDSDLNALMDDQVKPALGGVIPDDVQHETSSTAVFNALGTDFMKPVTDIVEQLLNETDVQVNVVSGQLDLIVDTPGTLAWAERLKWDMGDYWTNQGIREPLVVDGIIEGFMKRTSRFKFYWINRAGHMVPTDNPAAGVEVLKRITGLIEN